MSQAASLPPKEVLRVPRKRLWSRQHQSPPKQSGAGANVANRHVDDGVVSAPSDDGSCRPRRAHLGLIEKAECDVRGRPPSDRFGYGGHEEPESAAVDRAKAV